MREIFLRKQSNVLSAAAVMMGVYGLSSIMGLVRTRLLASYFLGTQAAWLDVYNAASWLPETIFQLLVVGALSAAFVPTFSRLLNKDKTLAWTMVSGAISLAVMTVTIVSAMAFVFAHPLSNLLAPGFSDAQINVMANLLRLMLVAQIFFAVSGFFMGIIQSFQRFLVPALAPVIYNLGIILGIVVLSPFIGIYGPAVGVVVGALGHMLLQLPLAKSLGFTWRWVWKGWQVPGVIEILHLMPARVVALGVDQIEQYIAILLSSFLVPGSLSLFNIARALYHLPVILFGATIGQAALPALSHIAAQDKPAEFTQTLTNAILQVGFLALPISTLFIILRIPVVRLAFGASSFPWLATLLTGKVLAVLAISAGFYAVMQIIIRGFYALHDTTTPLAIGVLAASFNLILSLILVNRFELGIVGLGIAVSATSILETIALTIVLFNRLSSWEEISPLLLKPLGKMLVINLIMGLGLWLPMRLLDEFVFDTTRTLPLLGLSIFTTVLGFSVYLSLSYLLKIEQLSSFVQLVRRLSQWKQILASTPATTPVSNE